MLTVSQLFIYPVKSLGGIAVSSAHITERGLQYDRRWMLVDETHTFLSQRDIAAMALFEVAINENGLLITHRMNNDVILLPFVPQTTETITVEVWDDQCTAIVVSHEANRWFSQRMGMNCKLVYMPDATHRMVDSNYSADNEIVSFADGYPMLLIGQSSLDDLNSKLEEKMTMQRFRPNIVFTGGEPFEEDVLDTFTINNIKFYGVKLCARCVVTTINPDTAAKGKEPLRTLAAYRMQNNKIYFGQNLLHKGEGIIQTGDAMEVLKRKETTYNFKQANG